MTARDFLRKLLHTHKEAGLSYEKYRTLLNLAEDEGLPPEALAARLIDDGLQRQQEASSFHARWESLSRREQEVAVLAIQGYSNGQIALKLCISTDTVKTHVHRLLTKLGLRSKAELRKAARSGQPGKN